MMQFPTDPTKIGKRADYGGNTVVGIPGAREDPIGIDSQARCIGIRHVDCHTCGHPKDHSGLLNGGDTTMAGDLGKKGMKNQVKGAAKEVAGKARKNIGDMTDNRSEELKGAAKEMEGKTQRKVGETESKINRNT